MSDAVATMGDVLPADVGGRDAVHVAVVSATACEVLLPGQDVTKEGRADGKFVGIVDPFLRRPLVPGERYWIFLYPRSITSLKHVWVHPDFPDEAPPPEVPDAEIEKARSEQWLQDYVASHDVPSYHMLLGLAAEYIDSDYADDEHLTVYGSDAHGEIPPEFWDHAETVLGRKIDHGRQRPSYFSCSC